MHDARITKSIKVAGTTAVVAGAINIIALFSDGGQYGIDAIMFFGFAFGIYVKSRFCAVAAFALAIASTTHKLVTVAYYGADSAMPEILGMVLYIIIAIFLYQGIWGTIVYRYQDDDQQGDRMN